MIPIVLHHGLGGMPGRKIGPFRFKYFRGVGEAFAARGHPVLQTRVHPTGAIAERAAELKQQIVEWMDRIGRPDEPVLVVGHSMGGLDARYMIRKLDMDSRVAAMLSITTPHRGSPVADFVTRPRLRGRVDPWTLVERLGLNFQAVRDLTTERCRRFNDDVTDSDRVKYFSVSASRPWHRVPAFAVPAHRIVQSAEGDNDALVSVRSSVWGRDLGVWPADHWHTIGLRLVVELTNPTGSIVPYYEKAVEQVLAELPQSAG